MLSFQKDIKSTKMADKACRLDSFILNIYVFVLPLLNK